MWLERDGVLLGESPLLLIAHISWHNLCLDSQQWGRIPLGRGLSLVCAGLDQKDCWVASKQRLFADLKQASKDIYKNVCG